MSYVIRDDLPVALPCPFCGRDPVLQKDQRYPRPTCEVVDAYEVICNTPGCVIYHADNRYFLDPLEAIERWNARKWTPKEGMENGNI